MADLVNERALEVCEEVLGHMHPYTATIVTNLTECYKCR
jgi:hypothetical protein